MIKQVFLDIETTGINKKGNNFYYGHKIIEIGAVKVINRHITNKYFHVYLNPCRSIDQEAFSIHGINISELVNKPKFLEIADQLISFIQHSDLIIHNANFDVSFINYELSMINHNVKNISNICNVIDSLKIARTLFPGKKNSIDALCDRYCVSKNIRILHGALLDAKILANIFLRMTSSQNTIHFDFTNKDKIYKSYKINNKKLRILYANKEEQTLHEQQLDLIQKNGYCLWRNK
ncbi:MAG: DNA polymerase III subunit epsilon [Candidatus Lightella neohaematopini]|nr:DNA polymerase III subunit epsilon [Candidatus Lightella neohaematopini]